MSISSRSIISQGDEETIQQVEKLEALQQACLDSGKPEQAQVYAEQIEELLEMLRLHGVILVPPQASAVQRNERTTPADSPVPNPKPGQNPQGQEIRNPQQGRRIQFRIKQK
jgi:hypothetical protein